MKTHLNPISEHPVESFKDNHLYQYVINSVE